VIVLVCGGREYANKEFLYQILDKAHEATSITMIVHGAARGADKLAGQWAKERGLPVKEYPAFWDTERKAAGALRNSRMLADANPDLVIAFPGGKGTADMVKKARSAGVPVFNIVDDKGE